MSNNTMKAVAADDMTTLLQSLDVYDEILEGLHSCIFCEQAISEDNIGAIVPDNGEIKFCCNNAKCTLKMMGVGRFESRRRINMG